MPPLPTAKLLELHQTMTIKQIARYLSKSEHLVIEALERSPEYRPNRHKANNGKWNRKLPENVRELRATMKVKEIASKYQVSISAVYQSIRRVSNE